MDKSTAKMSAPYLRGWPKGDPEVLRPSAENTGMAAKTILHAVSFRNDAYAG